MRKTRFQQEISGDLGQYWQESAKKELKTISDDIRSGRITIDDLGVARNSIGRVVMADMLEKLTYVTDKVNEEATKHAREIEVKASIAEYKANYTGPSEEELAEMRAAFGPRQTILDVLTGIEIQL